MRLVTAFRESPASLCMESTSTWLLRKERDTEARSTDVSGLRKSLTSISVPKPVLPCSAVGSSSEESSASSSSTGLLIGGLFTPRFWASSNSFNGGNSSSVVRRLPSGLNSDGGADDVSSDDSSPVGFRGFVQSLPDDGGAEKSPLGSVSSPEKSSYPRPGFSSSTGSKVRFVLPDSESVLGLPEVSVPQPGFV